MRKAGLAVIVLLLGQAGLATAQPLPKVLPENSDRAHSWALSDKQYPSAKVCGECHPNQYKQWSLSSHAYANVSPMFNKFEQKINDLASGTISHFCVRCHASVGSALGERRDIAWWDRSPASREGITCVTCHRVGEGYGKTNAARRITPGDIHEPVFGPFETSGGLKAISSARLYQILVSPDQPNRPNEADGTKWIRIHQAAIQSDLLRKSEFCVSCHQVQVHPGIKLETVWEEYRASPAAKEGITCQQCHMSTNPGQHTGYKTGWAARVNNQYVNEQRPLTDHTFVGPGYPISHPGLFPFRLEESPFTPQQWLTFNYREEWGSDGFENSTEKVSRGQIPSEWQNPADRRKAWTIIQENLTRWYERRDMRVKMLESASHLDGPFIDGIPSVGKPLSFSIKISNLNKGHNLPSGSLGAQPELWLNVSLLDPDGKIVWESGYVDKYGDVADLQSKEVRERTIKHDNQLVSMQAKFITTNVKGTDREMYLPINLDVDQRPFIRPGGTPTSLLNHPPFARMEKRSIPPLGHRMANYKVPADAIKKAGTYRLAVRLRGRTEPIYFMEFVDSTRDMIRAENQWADDIHPYAVELEIR
jgi:nitrate/TMAO reductase-like tetraheme cytochrome c subunit